MANRDTFSVQSPKSDVQIVTASLKGAGASDMVPQASANGIKSDVVTATRASAGTFTLAFRHEYAELLGAYAFSRGATGGLKGRFSAIDVGAKTATLVVETAADGTSAAYTTGVTVAADTATLGAAGVVVDVIATTETGLFPAWTTGVTVTANAATMAVAGDVIAVIATTGTVTGPKQIINTGTPAAEQIAAWSGATSVSSNTTGALATSGFITAVELVAGGVTGAGNLRDSAAANSRDVRIVYDSAGIPTLSFLAGDAVSSCKYQQTLKGNLARGQVTVTYSGAGVATITFAAADAVTVAAVLIRQRGELQSTKQIIASGTAGAGQVKVTYSSGVPTLTFNVADHVTAATVMQMPASDAAGAVDPGTSDYIDIILVVRNSALN